MAATSKPLYGDSIRERIKRQEDERTKLAFCHAGFAALLRGQANLQRAKKAK